MLRTFAIAVTLMMFTSAFAADDEGAKALKALEGEWSVVKFTEKGEAVPIEGFKEAVYIYKGNQLILRFDPKEAGKALGTVKLDPTTKPRSMDVTDEKFTDKSIYELDGDTLRICSIKDKSAARPTEFKSTKENKAIILELKRVKK